MILNARHRAREIALQILYRNDVVTAEGEARAEKFGIIVREEGDEPVRPRITPNPPAAPLKPLDGTRATADDLLGHFEHFAVPDELRAFAAELVAATLADVTKTDELLEKHTANWKLTRMSVVDRSLLRLAVTEMMRFPQTSVSVVIDEAVELAKSFGNADSPAFVNGVLDAVKNQVRAD